MKEREETGTREALASRFVEKISLTCRLAAFSYGAHFSKFWAEEQGSGGRVPPNPMPAPEILDALKDSKSLVIVWASSPGPSRLAEHLTPIDWALAVCSRLLKVGSVGPAKDMGWFRIHILDLTSTDFESAFSVSMAASILEAMPWVKLYAPLARGRKAYELGFLVDSLSQGIWPVDNAMPSFAQCTRRNPDALRENLERINRAWRAWIVQSDDYHDLNNAIGPRMLHDFLASEEPVSESGSNGAVAPEDALFLRLRWAGLVRTRKDKAEFFPARPCEHGPPIGQIQILVVDDQINRDWGKVICRLFGEQPNPKICCNADSFIKINQGGLGGTIQLFGSTGPQLLVKRLKKANFRRRDYGFSLGPQADPSPEPFQIVLLDVRLHAASALSVEKMFVGELLEIVRERQLNDCAGLAWDAIDAAEIELIENWRERMDSRAGEGGHIAALTLLPRLIALASPLTPIILFSSSGRAALKEKLKGYRNIITEFEKPRVLSDDEAILQALRAFGEAKIQAFRMVRVRSQLHHAQKTSVDQQRWREGKFSTHVAKAHIEYYFDESGDAVDADSEFANGVAVCVYESMERADEMQKALHTQFQLGIGPSKVPVWAKRSEWAQSALTPNPNTLRLSKLTELKRNPNTDKELGEQAKVLTDFFAASKTAPAPEYFRRWCAIGVKRPRFNEAEFRDVERIGRLDHHLDLMLTFALAFGLFVLPKFLNIGEFSCRVLFDVRSAPLRPDRAFRAGYEEADFRADEALAEDQRLRFGFPKPRLDVWNPGRGKLLLKTYDVNSYYPLVRECVLGWPGPHRVKFEWVKGVPLTDGSRESGINDGEANRRQLLHDIADWVAGCARDSGAATLRKQFSDIFSIQSWYECQLKPSVRVLMDAVKRAEVPERGEALRLLLQCIPVGFLRPINGTIERVLCWALSDALALATGNDLLYAMSSPPRRPEPVVESARDVDEKLHLADLKSAWKQFNDYNPPAGCEVLRVSSEEQLEGQRYWILVNRKGDEVAVAPSRDAGSETKIDAFVLGSFEVWSKPVSREEKGLWSVCVVKEWLGDPSIDRFEDPAATGAESAGERCNQDSSTAVALDTGNRDTAAILTSQAAKREPHQLVFVEDPKQASAEATIYQITPSLIVLRPLTPPRIIMSSERNAAWFGANWLQTHVLVKVIRQVTHAGDPLMIDGRQCVRIVAHRNDAGDGWVAVPMNGG